MSRRNRIPLSPDEDARLDKLNQIILAALRCKPCTNADLSEISLDYGRRIRELRQEKHIIDRRPIGGGLNLYTLTTLEEPEWTVNVRVTLADGFSSIQTIKVRGLDEGVVRNRAQHLAHRVKVLESYLTA